MSLTTEQLDQAARIVDSSDTLRQAAALIREQLAPLQALVLDAMDMRAEVPVRQVRQRAIYLMATDGHCWSVTSQPDLARALVLTQE
jgi:hypothetical protein